MVMSLHSYRRVSQNRCFTAKGRANSSLQVTEIRASDENLAGYASRHETGSTYDRFPPTLKQAWLPVGLAHL
jgi:hypothetical protein